MYQHIIIWISGHHQRVSGSLSLIIMFVSCVLLLPSSYPPSGIIKDSSNTLNLILPVCTGCIDYVLLLFVLTDSICNCSPPKAPGDKINCLKGNITNSWIQSKQINASCSPETHANAHGSTSQIALSGLSRDLSTSNLDLAHGDAGRGWCLDTDNLCVFASECVCVCVCVRPGLHGARLAAEQTRSLHSNPKHTAPRTHTWKSPQRAKKSRNIPVDI